MKTILLILPLLISLTLAAANEFSTPAAFEPETEEAPTPVVTAPTNRPQTHLLLEAGVASQGNTDIDGGGEMQVYRYNANLLYTAPLSEGTRLGTAFLLGVSDYDFDAGGFGDPWGTVILNQIGVQLSQTLNKTWSIRGGGVLLSSRESGADFSDSLTGGGTFGLDCRASDTLFLSVGAAVVSQIEDDARITPIVAMNWNANERWTIRLGSIPVSGGVGAGAEGEYMLNESWRFGLGLVVNERRFRLDDSGPVPNGVGEDTTIPIRARLGWRVNDKTSLHFIVGVATGGKLRVEDSNGALLAKQDYDPAPYVAVRALFRF